jgi:hypothetical protein
MCQWQLECLRRHSANSNTYSFGDAISNAHGFADANAFTLTVTNVFTYADPNAHSRGIGQPFHLRHHSI